MEAALVERVGNVVSLEATYRFFSNQNGSLEPWRLILFVCP